MRRPFDITLVALCFSFVFLGTSSGELSAPNGTECAAGAGDATCSAGASAEGKRSAPTKGSDDLTWDSVSLCVDTHDHCEKWAVEGQCNQNMGFMLHHCMKSCKVCGDNIEDVPVDTVPCIDSHAKCPMWKTKNECEKNPAYMLFNCRRSCKACETSITSTIDFGVKQKEGGEHAAQVAAIIRESKKYMRKVMSDPASANTRENCRNGNEMCTIWAAEGHCEKHPSLMKLQCGPACQTCHLLDAERRCKIDPDAKDALGPGDLHRMFERIVDDEELAQYNVSIISRPYKSGDTSERNWRLGPWFLSFENFLTDEESDRLIEHGYKRGFGRSEEVIKNKMPDGSYELLISDYRSSYNSWCGDECMADPVVRRVIERIARVTDIPEENSEMLQILKYEKGQKYKEHADYIHYQKGRPCGVRVLTFFLYLNDEFEGGGTNFRFLWNMTLTPRKGRAVLWPNVMNDDPNQEDERFDHSALEVFSGTKFAANSWLHMRDFKSALDMNCA